MSVKNDKALNASLIAFNNHIVGMKTVVKKAKVNEIQKLIRKIKMFAKKKGNEEQLAKNKKKCENLKSEINEIKALKFNEISIFSIENDSTTFNEYLKSNKGLTSQKIALARVAFHRLVLDAINKMKTDPKIDGWKRTFIQYKARAEKRKNWKEKTRQLKEIESKLKLNDDELKELNNENENENQVEDGNEQVEKQKPNETTVNEKKKTPKKETPPKIKDRKVKFSDDESSNEEADLSEDELAEYNKPSSKMVPVKSSDGESNLENDDDDEDDEDDSKDDSEDEDEDDNYPKNELYFTSDDDSQTKSEIEYEVEKFEKPKEEAKPQLKPLIIENKPAKMEIKQINLDEIKDFSEIPISNTVVPENQEEETDNLAEETMTTIPLSSDPFFLDEDGREIFNSNFDNDLNRSDMRPSFRRNDRSYNNFNNNSSRYNSSYRDDSNKEAFRNKRESLNYSFKSSLSSRSFNNSESSTGYNRRTNDRNNNFNQRRDDYRNKFNNSSYKRPNEFNDNNYSNNKRPNFNKNFSNDSRPQFKDKGPFKKDNAFNSNRNGNSVKPNEPKSEDLSKLHPSWQAKKLQEEKLKSLKFEGKKVTFDED